MTGDLAAVRHTAQPDEGPEVPHLRVALVWGQPTMAEAFCWLGWVSADPTTAAVAKAGCRDPLGFVPLRVAANVAVEVGVPAKLELYSLPSGDDLFGAVSGRIGHASLVVYDDRNQNGTLDFRFSMPSFGGGPGSGVQVRAGNSHGPTDSHPECDENGCVTIKKDILYGASLVTLATANQRITFREGSFDAAAFNYPRHGCPEPPSGFSVLGAGGVSAAVSLAALSAGQLPPVAPSTCTSQSVDTTVTIALQSFESLRDIGCCLPGSFAEVDSGGDGMCSMGGNTSGAPEFQPPPGGDPTQDGAVWVCRTLPAPATPSDASSDTPAQPTEAAVELVVAQAPSDCKGLSHYLLRGCSGDPYCAQPDWSTTTPGWWPCIAPH